MPPWPEQTGPRISRRGLLVAGGSVLLLSACAAPGPVASPTSGPASGPPSLPTTPTVSPSPNTARHTVSELLGRTPFYVAHRGSGDNWVEHTLDAYLRSVEAGALAVEISVHATSDGVLVCHHDSNLRRMTGVDAEIEAMTWAELSQIENDARSWLGPNAALQPIPRLDDVLGRIGYRTVVFLEDKQGGNAPAILDLVGDRDGSRERTVWKQAAGAAGPNAEAQARGYLTWGYFAGSPDEPIEQIAPLFDLVGIKSDASDAVLARIVASGRPVIAWEVHRRSVRDRLVSLGVQGMMCSNVPYVTGVVPPAATDAFATGLRSAGDLPSTTWKIDVAAQPEIRPSARSIRFAGPVQTTYLLGSLGTLPIGRSKVAFSLRWPDASPSGADRAGIAIADDDRPVAADVGNDVSGSVSSLASIQITLDGLGTLMISGRTAVGSFLDPISTSTPAPKAAEWIELSAEVGPDGITVARRATGDRLRTTDYARAGGYLSVVRSSFGSGDVEFRHVSVSSLD